VLQDRPSQRLPRVKPSNELGEGRDPEIPLAMTLRVLTEVDNGGGNVRSLDSLGWGGGQCCLHGESVWVKVFQSSMNLIVIVNPAV
jgi:hypothetical protein